MKIKVKVNLINDLEENGMNLILEADYNKEKNEIIYLENDEFKTLTRFNFNNNRLYRENENLKLIYEFNKNKLTKGVINIKELDKKIFMNIETISINSSNEEIEIKFKVEGQLMTYKIGVI